MFVATATLATRQQDFGCCSLPFYSTSISSLKAKMVAVEMARESLASAKLGRAPHPVEAQHIERGTASNVEPIAD